MGYFTSYKLITNHPDFEKIFEEYRKLYSENGFELSAGDIYNNSFVFVNKWDNIKESLIDFSKQYPNIVFTLYGYGEYANDVWCMYVKNGKSNLAKAKITFDNFDESVLQ